MHQAVEDGVSQGRVIDPAMPVFEGQLAGQDGGAVAGAVVDHFQQVMPSPFLQRGQRPVVQHQDVDLGQLLQGAAEAAVAVGDTQLFQQPWRAQIQGGVALAAGLVTQGAGQPSLAGAGRAGQQQVVLLADPVAVGQAGDQALVQGATRAAVEIFQAGVGVLELGLLAQSHQTLVVTPGQFAVEQQAEAFIEAQAVAGRQLQA